MTPTVDSVRRILARLPLTSRATVSNAAARKGSGGVLLRVHYTADCERVRVVADPRDHESATELLATAGAKLTRSCRTVVWRDGGWEVAEL